MVKRVKDKPITIYGVIDYETDPFLKHRHPSPFVCGVKFVDPDGCPVYREFWDVPGATCTQQLASYIESLPKRWKFIFFAHNGGKFDFYYLMEEGLLGRAPMLINSRIVKAEFMGRHEIRDSYAMMPIALSQYAKDDMEYWKLERHCREKYRDEISAYLRSDCDNLLELATRFIDRFGPKLTVAAAAISKLREFHPVARRDETHDNKYRDYYFGGRVQCFETGACYAPPGRKFKIHDVNSMYPKAMRDFLHPMSGNYVYMSGADALAKFDSKTGLIKGFGKGPYFMRFIGENRGALPTRIESGPQKGGLSFDKQYGEFFACSHEIRVACELGLIRVDSIIDVHIATAYGSYDQYVDTYMAEKVAEKKAQKTDPDNARAHKANEIFAKFLLNSAYGKFAIDPRRFKNYFIYDNEADCDEEFEEWKADNTRVDGDGYALSVPELIEDTGRFEIWAAKAPDEEGFYDVAVAASITSASRSILLRAIHHAERPLYCDTDSLISLELEGVEVDDSALGAWKFEGDCEAVYIVGKKVYAAWGAVLEKDGTRSHKVASKGAKLSANVIRRLALKKLSYYQWTSDAPNFSLSKPFGQGVTKFVTRKIRSTA